MEIITKSSTETQKLGEKFGADLINKGPVVVALTGELGSGKTTFLKGVAKGMGISRRIVSPTFILMRKYDAKKKKVFYHVDLYRLDKDADYELENLGFNDLVKDKSSVIAIEWAEKAKKKMPPGTYYLNFNYVDDNTRKIVIKK